MKKMEISMGLNLLLLLAMVATNILSLYHLSSTRLPSPPAPTLTPSVPDHLLHQLHTLRATISHLTHHPTSSPPPTSPPPDLILFSLISPIASACSDHPHLLHQFMNYTPFSTCPPASTSLAEPLILRGCHPLPRRRCFTRSPSSSPSPVNDIMESTRLATARSALDLTLPQLLAIAKATAAAPIRLALDIGGGSGTLAAKMRPLNTTVLTTTLDLGQPNSLASALRGVVPLQAPLQQRFPVPDGAMDLVRSGHAVNRWIPATSLEFLLYDVDRVLRGGGLFWVDHFFCRAGDLAGVYAPMLGRLGYKRIKWAVGNKTDAGGIKFGEVYLTALLQKPVAV